MDDGWIDVDNKFYVQQTAQMSLDDMVWPRSPQVISAVYSHACKINQTYQKLSPYFCSPSLFLMSPSLWFAASIMILPFLPLQHSHTRTPFVQEKTKSRVHHWAFSCRPGGVLFDQTVVETQEGPHKELADGKVFLLCLLLGKIHRSLSMCLNTNIEHPQKALSAWIFKPPTRLFLGLSVLRGSALSLALMWAGIAGKRKRKKSGKWKAPVSINKHNSRGRPHRPFQQNACCDLWSEFGGATPTRESGMKPHWLHNHDAQNEKDGEKQGIFLKKKIKMYFYSEGNPWFTMMSG